MQVYVHAFEATNLNSNSLTVEVKLMQEVKDGFCKPESSNHHTILQIMQELVRDKLEALS